MIHNNVFTGLSKLATHIAHFDPQKNAST